MNRLLFDDDWSVLRGDLPQPVARNSAKAASCGMAADLSPADHVPAAEGLHSASLQFAAL